MNRSYKRFLLIIFVFSSLSRLTAQQPQLGINLAGPSCWNAEVPFLDPVKMAPGWVSQQEGKNWAQGPELDLDEYGYIRRLAPGCTADLNLLEGSRAPAGNYTLLYDGNGTFSGSRQTRVVHQEPGKVVFATQGGGFWIRLETVNPSDPVHNMRMLMPGISEKDLEKVWRPGFLESWQGMAGLRFTEWMMTNNSKIKKWEDRPRMQDMRWGLRGVPVELLCDLANRLNSDIWLNIPHQATDSYVESLAAEVKTYLNPELKIYLEYSNESYTAIYDQREYMEENGLILGFAPEKERELAGWLYYSYRSAEVSALFEYALGDRKEQLVRVFTGPTYNPDATEKMLQFQERHLHVDVLAISPYIFMRIPEKDAENTAKKSVLDLLSIMQKEGLKKAQNRVVANRKLAEKYKLKLVAYEGGQLFEAFNGAENNPQLKAKIIETNRHPRMEELYLKLFDLWQQNRGELFMLYKSAGEWDGRGSPGIKALHSDTIESSPKLRAVIQQADEWGQPLSPRP